MSSARKCGGRQMCGNAKHGYNATTCLPIVPVLRFYRYYWGSLFPKSQQLSVREAFVIAMTHSIDEVRFYTAWGIGQHLWSIDRELALRCVNAIAVEAILVEKAREVEKKAAIWKTPTTG